LDGVCFIVFILFLFTARILKIDTGGIAFAAGNVARCYIALAMRKNAQGSANNKLNLARNAKNQADNHERMCTQRDTEAENKKQQAHQQLAKDLDIENVKHDTSVAATQVKNQSQGAYQQVRVFIFFIYLFFVIIIFIGC
jgi:hypothetical protein